MNDRKRTIDHMKERREAPAEARELAKRFARMRKTILGALRDGPLTIPEIAERTGLPPAEVTYGLMTLRKFGQVETLVEDDVDEYYRYRAKD
ncbi:MAG: helix-turn-helix domain-containing protein [Candidatus Krumholzibacteriota bacterium]|nr:helix-turn-helix domain-containing protein [Candidatus Krumholzibacteriota bacterium]